MKSSKPMLKIGLIFAIILLGIYSFLVYLDIQEYQQVHTICSKAVKGFPQDKLAALGRSDGLKVLQTQGNTQFSNDSCTCNIKTENSRVVDNQGTYCAKLKE